MKMPRTTTPAEPDDDADDIGQTDTDRASDKANRAAAKSAGPGVTRTSANMADHMFAHHRPRTDG